MLAEDETIASAHFELHGGLRQSFRFYLGIVGLPLTVLAVVLKDQSFELYRLPTLLRALTGLTPFLGLFMFLSMVSTRLDITLYTRTVNNVRGYFLKRSADAPSRSLAPFLSLPTSVEIPLYRERWRGEWWIFVMTAVINSAYAFVFVWNFQSTLRAGCAAAAFFALHVGAYEALGWDKERRPISGA
jgi:hypothetical protein